MSVEMVVGTCLVVLVVGTMAVFARSLAVKWVENDESRPEGE